MNAITNNLKLLLSFEEMNQKYKELNVSAEAARENLITTIASTEAVVPQQMVKEAAMKAANLNPAAYEEQKTSIPGPGES